MRTLPLVSLAIVTGAAVGIGGPLLDASASPLASALGAVLVAGWCYAAVTFCLGMAGTSKLKAATVGTAALLITVVSYYSIKAAQGDFRTVDLSETSGREFFSWGEFASMTLYWCLAALILGPLLSVAGWTARQGAENWRDPAEVIAQKIEDFRLQVRGKPSHAVLDVGRRTAPGSGCGMRR
ncbi:hypothetical protein ACF09J_21565 [Streptomyces sp. NPDC014889]|uniref:hypothetical protein n=1 Tax=Streptomyces sp. NPDC014889 TaxID=3364928 RepID=UPI0036FE9175